MAKELIRTKPHIPRGENVFYLFRLTPVEYVLYDSGMGDPVAYGSINKLMSKLDKHLSELNDRRKQPLDAYVWKLERDTIKGWRVAKKMNGVTYEDPDNPGLVKRVLPMSPLKDIGYAELYFWFDAGDTHYLYDTNMGNPVWYGSRGKIYSAISVHAKRHSFGVHLYHLPPKSQKPTWKMRAAYNMKKEDVDENTVKEKRQSDILIDSD